MEKYEFNKLGFSEPIIQLKVLFIYLFSFDRLVLLFVQSIRSLIVSCDPVSLKWYLIRRQWGKNMLNHTSPWRASGLFWKFVILVFAGCMSVSCFLFVDSSDEDPPPADETDPNGDSSEPSMPCDPISGKSIAALQFEETGAEEKIHLIDELGGLDDENLQKCLQAITHKEVIALTILDLSRHTNSELAEKAEALLERFDLAVYVDREIDSEDEERLQKIVEFLLRIEPDQAKNILEQISFETEEAGQIVEKVSNGVHRVLVPTNSDNGDRYYVRVSWDPASAGQVSCLTTLFNKELSTQRNLEQEGQKMKELNGNRWIYWYSKDWVLSMAESVDKCGGEAAFVSGEGAQIPSVCCTSDQTAVSDLPPEDEEASVAMADATTGDQETATSEAAPDSAPVDQKATDTSEVAPDSPPADATDTASSGGEVVPDSSATDDVNSVPKKAVTDSPQGDAATTPQTETASAPSSGGETTVREFVSDSGVKVTVTSTVITGGGTLSAGESAPSTVPASQPDPEELAVETSSDVDVLKEWDDNEMGEFPVKRLRNMVSHLFRKITLPIPL